MKADHFTLNSRYFLQADKKQGYFDVNIRKIFKPEPNRK